MENIYLYLGLAALVVILIIGMSSKTFKAQLSKSGLNIDSNKEKEKSNISMKNIKNKSSIDLTSRSDQNVNVEDIDSSKINIK